MRIAGCLIVVLVSLGVQSTPGQEPSAGKTKLETKTLRQFTVDCHFTGRGMNDLTPPKMIVREGEKKSCGGTERKSVTFDKKTDNAGARVKRELIEGVTLEAKVVGNGDDEAILDLSFEMSGSNAGANKVIWLSRRYQMIACVTLGTKFIAKLDDLDLEIVVNALPVTPPEASKHVAYTVTREHGR
jgi:hypothetical protein